MVEKILGLVSISVSFNPPIPLAFDSLNAVGGIVGIYRTISGHFAGANSKQCNEIDNVSRKCYTECFKNNQ
ncbi:MAG: hypothetical protein IPF54_20045 [Draconibacterium sp.]|nr:hypothetical protein [Draconibacterium sp.]